MDAILDATLNAKQDVKVDVTPNTKVDAKGDLMSDTKMDVTQCKIGCKKRLNTRHN